MLTMNTALGSATVDRAEDKDSNLLSYPGPTFPASGAVYAVYAIVAFSRHNDCFKTGKCGFFGSTQKHRGYIQFLVVPMHLASPGIEDFALFPQVPSEVAGKARPLLDKVAHGIDR